MSKRLYYLSLSFTLDGKKWGLDDLLNGVSVMSDDGQEILNEWLYEHEMYGEVLSDERPVGQAWAAEVVDD